MTLYYEKTTLRHKNVLFYSKDSLFEEGITSLISNEEGVRLTVVQANDGNDLLDASKEFSPEVIIIEQSLMEKQENFLKEMLDNMHDACLITLDKIHNVMHVYTHHDISIKRASDLLDVIQSHVNHPKSDETKGEKNI